MANEDPPVDSTPSRDELNETSSRNRQPRPSFDRRTYLRLAGAATAGGLGAVASASAETTATHHGIKFDTVVNAVEDLGMDPTGTEPIDEQLTFSDGTLVEFPPGDYLVRRRQNVIDKQNIGIRGLGDERTDVRFAPPDGDTVRLFNVLESKNVLVENITFDQRSEVSTGIENRFHVADGLEIHEVKRIGQTPNDEQSTEPLGNDPGGFNITVYESSGVAVVEDYVDTTETDIIDYPGNATGIFVPRSSTGTVYLRNCRIENRGEHAIYASHAIGNLRVEGGRYVNNVNTNMRIAGSGSYVKDATIGYTRDVEYTREGDTGELKNVRGIKFDSPLPPESLRDEYPEAGGESGGLVQDCDFVFTSEVESEGLIFVAGSTGGIEFRDNRLRNDADTVPTVVADPPGSGPRGTVPDGDASLRFVDSSFTGSSSAKFVDASDRTVEFVDCCIDMPNADRTGDATYSDVSHGDCKLPKTSD